MVNIRDVSQFTDLFNTQQLIFIGVVVIVFLFLLYVVYSRESIPSEWSYDVVYEELTPREFEELVRDLWEDKGYNATISDKGPDGGVDVGATKRGVSVGIEVKQYNESSSVGRPIVQKCVAASQQYGYSKAAVVTTSYFTEPAVESVQQFRSRSISVELYDGEKVINELEQSSIEPKDVL